MDIAPLQSTPAASASATTQFAADFDTFLTLLTTQLQNQDPLKPLDTEKFTEQLVQFASVEQSIQTNQHLEALIALQSSSANETALATVGKLAEIASDGVTFAEGPVEWRYELPREAASVTLQVADANGVTVATLPGETRAGRHIFSWDGRLDNGSTADTGEYRLSIAAVDAEGEPIAATTDIRGLVDSAVFNDGAPKIEIAGALYDLSLLSRVEARTQYRMGDE
ncbi:MAG: flagellar hook assembly protein FlgD [Pseudomonadota bacterium]